MGMMVIQRISDPKNNHHCSNNNATDILRSVS